MSVKKLLLAATPLAAIPFLARDPSKGAAYDAYADKSSWAEMTRLFHETL